MRVSLAASHLMPHDLPGSARNQGFDPLDSTGFQQAIEEARAQVWEIKETEWSAASHKTRPKSRHMLIEERIQASTVPRNSGIHYKEAGEEEERGQGLLWI